MKNFSSLALAAALFAGGALANGFDESTLKAYLEHETAAIPGRVEVSVGEIDPHMRLMPCARTQPFLSPGARLWGYMLGLLLGGVAAALLLLLLS